MPEILGRFELVDKLATGGMGDVYLAKQWGDGGFVRQVVVKRLHPHLSERPAQLDDFRNEAQLLGLLTHPGIPHIIDFRFEQGRWYIAMEHVRGPTLGAVRRAEQSIGRVMPWKAAIGVTLQLCDILGYVHERRDDLSDEPLGIVHGDLSPENVILGRDGQVRLLDFGIAGDVEHRQRQREREKGIRGTLGYIAPEAISKDQPVDQRADVFVLGVLLYEMTTGQRLFPGDGLNYVNAVLQREPVAPSEHRRDYPADLEAVLLRTLARDVDARPAGTRELRRALEDVARAHELPTSGRVVSDYAETLFPAREDRLLQPSVRPDSLETRELPAVPLETDPNLLSPEERAEVLADLRDLMLPDMEELDPDELASIPPRAAPPPPPSPTEEPPSETKTRVRRPPGESEAGAQPGFYIHVADED
ncbi:MAG: serine/threonine protein kinase [Myxococcales bacterium]|nr:serine/threonine protein kinase [Myxococcales bacterium]